MYNQVIRKVQKMIQSLNSVNSNTYQKNPNFSSKNATQSGEQVTQEQKKPSKAKNAAVYAGTQFAAGAIFSSLLNTACNVIEKCKKIPNKEKIMSAPAILKSAAVMGGMFVLMGFLVNGIFSLAYRNKNQ